MNPERRKARIHVHPDGLVEVETPLDVSLAEAKQALLKRARWVSRHLAEIETRRAEVLEREYVSGETAFYLGRRHSLKIVTAEEKPPVKMHRGQLRIADPKPTREAVKAALYHWYRQRAREVFARRIDLVADRLPWVKEEPPGWSLREMKTQWGSCSPSGALILNPHLIKAPTRCIDYVILHELCHLAEHNHSPKFYQLLSRSMPDWQAVKERLDGMSDFYLNE